MWPQGPGEPWCPLLWRDQTMWPHDQTAKHQELHRPTVRAPLDHVWVGAGELISPLASCEVFTFNSGLHVWEDFCFFLGNGIFSKVNGEFSPGLSKLSPWGLQLLSSQAEIRDSRWFWPLSPCPCSARGHVARERWCVTCTVRPQRAASFPTTSVLLRTNLWPSTRAGEGTALPTGWARTGRG